MNKITIPDHLINEIRRGNCVAFVGAGFSAPAIPDWDTLLSNISKDTDVRQQIKRRISQLLSHEKASLRGIFDREAAAQILQEELGANFAKVLKDVLGAAPNRDLKTVEVRKKWLYQIPFQSILTTNFDHMLSGKIGSPDVYRDVLRKAQEPWFNLFEWTTGDRLSDVVKLHGDVDIGPDQADSGVVLTRADYRKLLFEDSRYSNFLRAILATRTVLFLGFSFSDAYLNLLRSEVLALLRHDPDQPLAYAVLDNVDQEEADFFLQHEGIKALVYDSTDGDHSGFDRYLGGIHELTAPIQIIGRLLQDKKLLWLDPNPNNNLYGKQLISKSTDNGCELVTCKDPMTALRHLSECSFDLVISHWGHGLAKYGDLGEPRPNAVELMEGIRKLGIEVPVIVFASPDPQYASSNRLKSISLWAFEYAWTFEGLFEAIEKIFAAPNLTLRVNSRK